jgi:hypothetical protein
MWFLIQIAPVPCVLIVKIDFRTPNTGIRVERHTIRQSVGPTFTVSPKQNSSVIQKSDEYQTLGDQVTELHLTLTTEITPGELFKRRVRGFVK